jgi:hypothetical protein
MRIDNNIAMVRSPDMAAARARDIQQTGLTAGTLREINKDTEDDMHRVQDRPEVEGARVRTDAESENTAGQQQQQQEQKKETPPEDEGSELRRLASERLLDLPVNKRKDAELEARRFDIRI